MISTDFRKFARHWNGKGRMIKPEMEAVTRAIETAHAAGKPIRFWDAPEGTTAYFTLHRLGVDIFNTDYPAKCALFFSDWTNKNFRMGRHAVQAGVTGTKKLDKATRDFQGFQNEKMQLDKGIEVYTPTYRNDGSSKKVKNVAKLRKGATVTIPNDPSNGGRALLLLEDAGLIKLRPNIGVKATVLDIVSNPRKLRIREVEAAQVPRTLDDVDLAVVNSNYAIGVGLNPVKDSIYLESKTSPYAVVVATLKGHEADAKVQALVKALTSAKVRKFMIEQYKGSVVPVF
jgi:YaeC family lipoprotein